MSERVQVSDIQGERGSIFYTFDACREGKEGEGGEGGEGNEEGRAKEGMMCEIACDMAHDTQQVTCDMHVIHSMQHVTCM